MVSDRPPSTRRLSELRASDLADHLGPESILVLPIGAVEQHGPHLPFSTDLEIARSCAEAVVDQAGEELDLWLLEPLAYTKSNEHAGTPGTVWLGPETLLRVLDDIGRSLAATPARKLALLNGHGGNSSLLNVACRELRLHHDLETFLLHPSLPPDQGSPSISSAATHSQRRSPEANSTAGRSVAPPPDQGSPSISSAATHSQRRSPEANSTAGRSVAPPPDQGSPSISSAATHSQRRSPEANSTPPDQGGPSELPDDVGAELASELGMGIHAGRAETSLMLHLRPDLVRMDLARRNVPEHLADNRQVRFGGSVTFGWLAADFGDGGTIGDPTGADADTGAALFKLSVEQLIEAVTEIRDFRFRP